MRLRNDRLLLHLARDRRRVVDPHVVYFLEAGTLDSPCEKHIWPDLL